MAAAINLDERSTFEADLHRIEEQLRSANALSETGIVEIHHSAAPQGGTTPKPNGSAR
jgi:hypothetical protein